jgi:hypothetical protein
MSSCHRACAHSVPSAPAVSARGTSEIADSLLGESSRLRCAGALVDGARGEFSSPLPMSLWVAAPAMHHVPEFLRLLQREDAHAIQPQLRRLEVRHDEDPALADVNELEAAEGHLRHGRPGPWPPQHQVCAAVGVLDGGVHGATAMPFQREVRQGCAHARRHAALIASEPWNFVVAR